MVTVFLVHPDDAPREALATALAGRDLEVHTAANIEEAIDRADNSPVRVFLVCPTLLEKEEMDIRTRLSVRAGHDVMVAALANVADPARKKAIARHEALLLPRPADDVDAMASFLKALAQDAADPKKPEPTPMGRMKISRLVPNTEEDLEAPVGPDGEGPIVLVVDDEEDCRELFAKVLSGRGYRVQSVASANAALRFLSKQRVHLIVSDISMPVMDGFELKAMLDERPGERIPFIAVAGTDSPERHELAKKLGVAALLGKPIQVREFCRVVRGTLMPAS